MKTKLLLIAVSCLFLFSVTGQTQPAPSPEAAMNQMNQMLQSPFGQEMMKTGVRAAMRSFWEGQGSNLMVIGLMSDPDIRAAWGVTDEQHQQFQNFQNPMNIAARLQSNPEFQQLQAEMQAIPNLPALLTGQNVDEEAQTKFLGLQEKITSLTMTMMSDHIDSHLTPELKQKMKESQLATMSEMPFVTPDAFEALNLTDAQKRQMEGIKKELEPEFEKNLKKIVDGQVILANKLFAEAGRQGTNFTDAEGMQAIVKKLANDPEYKKTQEELLSQGKAFSTLFRTKMFDVLTDEQWARLQELIDNPPVYAAVLLKKMREQRGENERGGAWQPGPGAWKPGESIPEQYRQERNTRSRFPRGQE